MSDNAEDKGRARSRSILRRPASYIKPADDKNLNEDPRRVKMSEHPSSHCAFQGAQPYQMVYIDGISYEFIWDPTFQLARQNSAICLQPSLPQITQHSSAVPVGHYKVPPAPIHQFVDKRRSYYDEMQSELSAKV